MLNDKKTNTKFVLGGGISGLIFGYYNPEFTILTDSIGGKLKTKFISMTTLLHKDENTLSLLKELDLSFDFVRHEIRYLNNDILQSNISQDIRETMIRKKMTDVSKLPELEEIDIVDRNLSTNTNFIELIGVKSTDLLDALLAKVKSRIVCDRVCAINKQEIHCENNVYKYDKLISTIPANIFQKVYKDIDFGKLEFKPMTFVLSEELPESLKFKTNDFDLIYNADVNDKWIRMNKNGNKYLYEFTGIISEDKIKDLFIAYDNYHIENVAIIKTKQIEEPKNIMFLGRFAMWQHKFKIHDAIRFAKNYMEINKNE